MGTKITLCDGEQAHLMYVSGPTITGALEVLAHLLELDPNAVLISVYSDPTAEMECRLLVTFTKGAL